MKSQAKHPTTIPPLAYQKPMPQQQTPIHMDGQPTVAARKRPQIIFTDWAMI